ncbi:MAG: DUF11 domain-containing protein [Chloroflexi bacterium]|nr:DUF11 domain-containing protein [Chloroflexota bacterium]
MSKPNRTYRILLGVGVLCLIVAAMLYALAMPSVAHAAPGVTIASITPYALVDNQATNCTNNTTPHAMYLQVNITNTSGSTLTNVQATLGFSTAGFALAGGQAATIYLGTLAPGEVRPVFWYVTYPCTYGTVGNYTVSVTDSTPGSTNFNGTLTTRNELTANAGGNIYTAVLGPGVYVGQVITYQVRYAFGNASNNADAQIQPAGNPSLRADCFQLISNTVDYSDFTSGLIAGANNRLYFYPVDSSATNNYVDVTYYFRVLCAGNSSDIYPYADLKTGGQVKYTGNYGSACTSIPCTRALPPPENSFQINKTASAQSVSSGGILTYTVRITNTASVPVLLDAITDTLPSGSGLPATTYQDVTAASFVQSSNSSYMPASGSSGTIYWLSKPNQTWSISANSAIELIYRVQFPVSAQQGTYINTVTARTGNTEIGPRGYGVGFNQPTAVTLSSFGARADAAPDFGALAFAAGACVLGCVFAGARWRRKK